LASLLAGFVSKRLFGLSWSAIDDQRPPDPKQRVESHRKLIAALVLEGALVYTIRGGLDHASRHGYARVTGAWPGEENTTSG
jgi:uncharacterized protein DUF4235